MDTDDRNDERECNPRNRERDDVSRTRNAMRPLNGPSKLHFIFPLPSSLSLNANLYTPLISFFRNKKPLSFKVVHVSATFKKFL
ncbi:hypothetical protein MRB53_023647 [Persea americana]|uniref:Uncharacterized protein n=1 Tax=Persea americana TaxID=3435 RepID=A0ACC2LA11_PERAE|nr:hypothetical protein MRB53_023647 [Persea americana]